jgi:hypothetical protein
MVMVLQVLLLLLLYSLLLPVSAIALPLLSLLQVQLVHSHTPQDHHVHCQQPDIIVVTTLLLHQLSNVLLH